MTTAIGVRSAPNLIRPAHIFRYLKQGRHEEIKASVDYFIDREVDNGFWKLPDDEASATRKRSTTSRALTASSRRCSKRNTSSTGSRGTATTCSRAARSSITARSASSPPSTTSIATKTSTVIRLHSPNSGLGQNAGPGLRASDEFDPVRHERDSRSFKNAECLRVFDEAFASERDQRMLWRIGFTPEQICYLMNNAQKRCATSTGA